MNLGPQTVQKGKIKPEEVTHTEKNTTNNNLTKQKRGNIHTYTNNKIFRNNKYCLL